MLICGAHQAVNLPHDIVNADVRQLLFVGPPRKLPSPLHSPPPRAFIAKAIKITL